MDVTLIPGLLAESPSADHEHGWQTESAHVTSQGRVVYVRCTACGSFRVDLQLGLATPPAAVSSVIAEHGARERHRTGSIEQVSATARGRAPRTAQASATSPE